MSRIILALDELDYFDLAPLFERFEGKVAGFKLGMGLYQNPSAVKFLYDRHRDKEVRPLIMVDLKFKLNPGEMRQAIKRFSFADFITIWAINQEASIRVAVETAQNAQIIAVTIPTTMSLQECVKIHRQTPDDMVQHLGQHARKAGVHGLVYSGWEGHIRDQVWMNGATSIMPGIRTGAVPLGPHDDQQRIVSPADAIYAGATYLVVGRPILQAPDPEVPLQAMNAEVNRAVHPHAPRS